MSWCGTLVTFHVSYTVPTSPCCCSCFFLYSQLWLTHSSALFWHVYTLPPAFLTLAVKQLFPFFSPRFDLSLIHSSVSPCLFCTTSQYTINIFKEIFIWCCCRQKWTWEYFVLTYVFCFRKKRPSVSKDTWKEGLNPHVDPYSEYALFTWEAQTPFAPPPSPLCPSHLSKWINQQQFSQWHNKQPNQFLSLLKCYYPEACARLRQRTEPHL